LGIQKKYIIFVLEIKMELYMDSKIQELTDKLLSEGVEKGKLEAEKIIASAKDESAAIIADAKKKADEIIAAAKKESESLNENTKSELKMYSAQALSALKTEVANVLTNNAVSEVVKQSVADKDFMNKFLLKLAEKWGAQEDIVISAEDAEGLKAVFAKQAKSLLDKSVKIEGVHGQKALFTIEPADGSYKVNFGEEEFEDYFKSFLRPQLVDMLF
jgi:V/A-type H+-transporting ATPase subunit E